MSAEAAAPTFASLVPDVAMRPTRTPLSMAWSRYRRNKLAIAGSIVFGLLIFVAIFAEFIAPYGKNEIDLFNITAPPSRDHLLGTDALGRDELSRLIYGARLSL